MKDDSTKEREKEQGKEKNERFNNRGLRQG